MTRKPLGTVRFATLALVNAAVLTIVAVSVAADPGDLVTSTPGVQCYNQHCQQWNRNTCSSCCRECCEKGGPRMDCNSCCTLPLGDTCRQPAD